jgi:glycosyltransferase involved in cell wall biosynthesis
MGVDAVVVVSREGQDYYRDRFPEIEPKLHLISNGVDTDHFKPGDVAASRKRWGLKVNQPVIVSVGRLAPQKDLQLTIQTFQRLKSIVPGCQLVIAGDGDLREEIVETIERERVTDITLLGAVASKDIPSVCASGDAFLLTSKWEGLPYALLEALACDVPIVTTAVGECPAIVGSNGQCGYVAKGRDAHELAQLLARAIRSRPAKGACRGRAMDYSARNSVAKLDNLLTSL